MIFLEFSDTFFLNNLKLFSLQDAYQKILPLLRNLLSQCAVTAVCWHSVQKWRGEGEAGMLRRGKCES